MSTQTRTPSVHRGRKKPLKDAQKTMVRQMLLDCGFTRHHPEHAPNVPSRAVYRKATIKVLCETIQQPYWTVQRLSWGSVDWFVDIPLACGADVLQSFLVALEMEEHTPQSCR